jgi:hypothetical protein
MKAQTQTAFIVTGKGFLKVYNTGFWPTISPTKPVQNAGQKVKQRRQRNDPA